MRLLKAHREAEAITLTAQISPTVGASWTKAGVEIGFRDFEHLAVRCSPSRQRSKCTCDLAPEQAGYPDKPSVPLYGELGALGAVRREPRRRGEARRAICGTPGARSHGQSRA